MILATVLATFFMKKWQELVLATSRIQYIHTRFLPPLKQVWSHLTKNGKNQFLPLPITFQYVKWQELVLALSIISYFSSVSRHFKWQELVLATPPLTALCRDPLQMARTGSCHSHKLPNTSSGKNQFLPLKIDTHV